MSDKSNTSKDLEQPQGAEKEKEKRSKEVSPEEIIENIVKNYNALEESIVSQLSLSYRYHGTMTGTSRENIWLQLFELIIPKKFVIEHSVIIIDSRKHVSKEVDLAIVDQNYTPYIFQYGNLKFIPIEAVAAVVECKSTSAKKESLKKWIDSIKALKTSQRSIARMATSIVKDGLSYDSFGNGHPSLTQTSTRPICIFCGYRSEVDEEFLIETFDFALIAGRNENTKKIDVLTTKHMNTLSDWYQSLNHGKVVSQEEKPFLRRGELLNENEDEDGSELKLDEYNVIHNGEEVSLMSFNFLLNQLLALINNPMLFPHRAYAQLFTDKGQEHREHEEQTIESDKINQES